MTAPTDTRQTDSRTGSTTVIFSNPILLRGFRFLFVLTCFCGALLFFGMPVAYLYHVPEVFTAETDSIIAGWGLSREIYLFIVVLGTMAMPLVYFAVAGLIIRRRWDSPYHVLMSAMLVAQGALIFPGFYFFLLYVPYSALYQLLFWVFQVISVIAWTPFVALLITFPDGRVYPRWSMVVALLSVIITFIWPFLSDEFSQPSPVVDRFLEVSLVLVFAAIPILMIYRYKMLFTPVERQQTKWFIFSFTLMTACIIVFQPLWSNLMPVSVAGTFDPTADLLNIPISFVQMLLPIGLGYAMLHARLWNIDLMINRSLVYSTVTAILLGLAILDFLLIQALLQAIFPTLNIMIPIAGAAVISVLVYQPLQRRVQHAVDRYLYRLRFDLPQAAKSKKRPTVAQPGALTGRHLGGYEVVNVLGRGGMGEVYQGYRDGETVALKVMPPELSVQPEFRTRFSREAQALKSLDHPHIVRFVTSGEEENTAFIALEYVEGGDLAGYLKRNGALPIEMVRRLTTQIAHALGFAHQRGIIHRDVKPSNVMLRPSEDGETFDAVLMDFGIAKLREVHTRYTATSGAIGTIDYMAPEQITLAREADYRADLYALGVMMYEMLTGKPVFHGNPGFVVFAHLQQPAPDPRDARPDTPRDLAKAVLRALEKKPEDRFTSAEEMADAVNG